MPTCDRFADEIIKRHVTRALNATNGIPEVKRDSLIIDQNLGSKFEIGAENQCAKSSLRLSDATRKAILLRTTVKDNFYESSRAENNG